MKKEKKKKETVILNNRILKFCSLMAPQHKLLHKYDVSTPQLQIKQF